MPPRQSAATDKAIRLYEKGGTQAEAARKAGVARSTVKRALERRAKEKKA
jgi:DNA invertase Pin-like site-specific DNA recombinase